MNFKIKYMVTPLSVDDTIFANEDTIGNLTFYHKKGIGFPDQNS